MDGGPGPGQWALWGPGDIWGGRKGKAGSTSGCLAPSSLPHPGRREPSGHLRLAAPGRGPVAAPGSRQGTGESPLSKLAHGAMLVPGKMGDGTTIRCEFDWARCWAQRRHSLIPETSLAPAPGPLQTWRAILVTEHLSPPPNTHNLGLPVFRVIPWSFNPGPSLDGLGPLEWPAGITAQQGPLSPLKGAPLTPHRLLPTQATPLLISLQAACFFRSLECLTRFPHICLSFQSMTLAHWGRFRVFLLLMLFPSILPSPSRETCP